MDGEERLESGLEIHVPQLVVVHQVSLEGCNKKYRRDSFRMPLLCGCWSYGREETRYALTTR